MLALQIKRETTAVVLISRSLPLTTYNHRDTSFKVSVVNGCRMSQHRSSGINLYLASNLSLQTFSVNFIFWASVRVIFGMIFQKIQPVIGGANSLTAQ